MRREPSELWWENVTGPLQMVSAMEYAMQDGKSVILRHPGFLPWQDLLRDLTHGVMDTIVIDRPMKKDEIIPKILEQFPQKYAINCPPVYKNQVEFVRSQHIFQGSTIWINAQDKTAADQVIRFVSDYRGNDYDKYGSFVLAVPAETAIPNISDRVEVICYQDYVRSNNLRLFSSLLVEDTPSIPMNMREYAAAVIASVCAPDPELIPALMEALEVSCETPDEVLRRMWEDGYWGALDRNLSNLRGHPFVLFQKGASEEFQNRIWRAQLQTLFSEIEVERTDIVKAHYSDIREALHTQYWDKRSEAFCYIKDPVNHCIIDDPYDAEIGVLAFMLTAYRDRAETEKLWYLPESETRGRINFLRTCRNSLAHITPCSPDSVARLLEKRGYHRIAH